MFYLFLLRAGGLHLQHAAAWLQKRLLRLRLPCVPHPLLGAAGQIVGLEHHVYLTIGLLQVYFITITSSRILSFNQFQVVSGATYCEV